MQTAIIALCTGTALVGLWLVFQRRRGLHSALLERPEIPVSELYRQFYSDLGVAPERFASWWEEVAQAFEVPAGRIRPADRFGVELPFRPMFGANDEDLFLFGALKRQVGRRTAKEALPKLETVDQFIRFIASSNQAA
jgi:hypothetical protein